MIWVRRVMLSGFLWLIVFALVVGIAAEQWVEAEGGLRLVVERWGIWGPLVGWLAKTVTSMTPIGAVLLPVAFGAVFDAGLAIFLNLTSGMVSGL